jgi:undecaprenyl-diphosphatase
MTWELHEDSFLSSLDQRILVLISQYRVTALNGPAVDISALGSPTVLSLFTLIGAMLLWLKQDRRGCAYLIVGSTGAGVGTFLLKHIFSRDRPSIVPTLVNVSGFSYPSGHSFGATSVYLLLMFLAWRKYLSRSSRGLILFATIAVISAVCFSRLYLGVHYPSDVLSGMFLGVAWICLLTYYLNRSAQELQLNPKIFDDS